MIEFNIIYRDSAEDTFTLSEYANTKNIFVPTKDGLQSEKSVSENIHWILNQRKLSPSNEAAELMNTAISVYTADQLVARDAYGFGNWSRYFRLYIPVVNIDRWNLVKEQFQDALNFLTGDHWELFFRKKDEQEKEEKEEAPIHTITKVSLLSGGLDSFIGVTDLLASGADLAVVGHHKSQGFENLTQKKLIGILKSEYPDRQMEEFLFNAQPVQQYNKFGKEPSSRARSILFIGLGIAVANSYGETIPLYIPENGLISLNIPLTSSRIGSSSTRTTHPYFLDTLSKILILLGIENKIINPYQFLTKGEMITHSKNLTLIGKFYNETVSCAHPNSKNVNVARRSKEEKNCGYCTPCIIRRAALKYAKMDKDGQYVFKINKNQPPYKYDIGRDYRAFKMALNRMKSNKPNLSLHILRSGPLPNKKEDLSKYVRTYEQGMKEVDDFLKE